MGGETFHHHYHILYDIRNRMDKPVVNFLEIGTCAGGSSCLMLSSPKPTSVVSVDLGHHCSPEIIEANVKKFGRAENEFTYIVGDSRTPEVVGAVQNVFTEVDILFIDGGHAYHEVIADFLNYKEMVVVGGFIVFDDYFDWQHSSQVKHAIDYIVRDLLFNEFEIVGTIENSLGAKPKEWSRNNLFVLRKL